jgi:hypothetical protein
MTPGASLVQSPIAALPARTAPFSAAAQTTAAKLKLSATTVMWKQTRTSLQCAIVFLESPLVRGPRGLLRARAARSGFRGVHPASPPQDEFAVANVYVSAACRDRESWGPNYETIFLQKALGWKKLYSKVRDRAAFAKATAPKEDALASTRAARTQAGRLFAPRKRVS